MKNINNLAIWIAILGLLFMGIKADTRSVRRDIKAMDLIGTNQSAIIQILKTLGE